MADKPHAATPSRRERARREGDVPRSPELVAYAAFASGALALWFGRGWLGASALHAFASLQRAATPEGLVVVLRACTPLAGAAVMPALAAGFAAVGAAAFEGGGLRVRGLSFSLQRLDPKAGLARMGSREAAIAGVRAAALFAIAVTALVPVGVEAVAAAQRGAGAAALAAAGIARALGTMLAVGGLFVAADHGLARLRWMRSLRMTHEELRRDLREHEGDPQLRGRRLGRHRELLRGGVERIREATFVVTNPSHVAVGLRYAPPAVEVPEVVVRARDEVAQRAKALARACGIPIVEDVVLARSLLEHGKVGSPIPRESYVAVAYVVAALIRRGVIRSQPDAP